jgi:hypothetical protein
MIDTKVIYEVQQELIALKTKARNIGYKNQIPRLPISNQKNHTSFESRMIGFNKRFRNWKHDLDKFENISQTPISSTSIAENGMIVHTSTDNK